jgi:hypothetical protein
MCKSLHLLSNNPSRIHSRRRPPWRVTLPFIYLPTLSPKQCEDELSTFRAIQARVERFYVQGRPRHHQPSAWQTECSAHQSAIFVVEFPEFSRMTAAQVRDVFRHRHILVLNSPLPEMPFDLSTLSQLRDVKKTLPIEGEGSSLTASYVLTLG